MEIHGRNSAVAKRLWNVLRITLYMARKGLVSKRKLVMDMNLMMNKRSKLLRKSLSNLMHHHHSRNHHVATRGYEFSCSNSPNPVFFRVPNSKRKHYFPCINPPQVAEETEFIDLRNAVVLIPKTPEYTYHAECNSLSPSPSPVMSRSPLSVRVSNYSSEEFEEMDGEVDDEAEEFIRRFYEQLRAQGRVQLLHYQETQYQEMLARGT